MKDLEEFEDYNNQTFEDIKHIDENGLEKRYKKLVELCQKIYQHLRKV